MGSFWVEAGVGVVVGVGVGANVGVRVGLRSCRGLSLALTNFFLRLGAVLKAIIGLLLNICLRYGSLRMGFQCFVSICLIL